MHKTLIRCLLFTTLLNTQFAHAALWYQGKVVDGFGFPIEGVQVVVQGAEGLSTSDANGDFDFKSSVVSINRKISMDGDIRFNARGFRLDGFQGKLASADLITLDGRTRSLFSNLKVQNSSLPVDLGLNTNLPSGLILLKIRIDGHNIQFKGFASGNRIAWPNESFRFATEPQFLAKIGYIRTLTTAKNGYQSNPGSVDGDTALDLRMTLWPQGVSVPAVVNVKESMEQREFKVPGNYEINYFSWMKGRIAKDYSRTLDVTEKSIKYKVIELDNGVVRALITPDLGMRIFRIIDKNGSSDLDLLQTMEVGNSLFRNQTMDMGGIKPSYPFYEHGTGLFTDTAGYFIRKSPDGSVSLVMNLRFDHYQNAADMGFGGRYTDRPLTGVVTLKPGSSYLEVSYIAENPNPLGRSNRIWNVAMFPNTNDKKPLFPTKYMISHGALKIGDYQQNGFQTGWQSNSHFAMYPQYPFCGMYYAGTNSNHLRIANPEKAPGMKYYPDGPIEIWGSTNPLFEAPDTLTNAFEPTTLKSGFWMARGIGEVTYANEFVAIAAANGEFKMVTSRPAILTIKNWDASVILENKVCGPNNVLSGTFNTGLIVLANGQELCKVKLPLEYNDNQDRYAGIKEKSMRSGGTGKISDGLATDDISNSNLNASRGTNFEMEGIMNKWSMLSSLAAIKATSNITSTDDPAILLSIANTTYRHGAFDSTLKILDSMGTNLPSQVKYLKALLDLELGKTADFSNCPIEGNYFVALQQNRSGNSSQAIALLQSLVTARPNAISPKLVLAYLKRDPKLAMEVVESSPGNLEAWAVLTELNFSGAAENLAGLLHQNSLAKTRVENFLQECKQASSKPLWRHERRFEYNDAMFVDKYGAPITSPVLPPFPEFLKY